MDMTTLALAKAYTDKKVEEADIGGVDLSEYVTKKELEQTIPSTDNIVNEVISKLPKYNGEVE